LSPKPKPENALPETDADLHDRLRGYLRAGIAIFLFNLVLAVYTQTNDPAGDIKRLWTAWSALGLGLGWLLCVWRFSLPVVRPRLFGGLIAAFLLLYGVATLRSPFLGLSWAEWNGFFFLATIYFIAGQVFQSVAQVQRLLATLCVAVALASLYGFLQKSGYDPFPWAERDTDVYLNLPATYGNPNFAAHTLILAIILALYLVTTGRYWCLVAATIFTVHLYYTGQRGGLVALAAAGALFGVAWLVGRRFQRPTMGAAVSVLLVGLMGVLGALGVMGLTRLLTKTPIPLETSLLIRYQSYVSATDMFAKAPLFGWGPGVYERAYPQFWTPFEQEWFAQETRKNAHVHNDVIEIAVDAGLPAAGLYLTLLTLGMVAALVLAFGSTTPAQRRLGYALAAVFMAFLVDGFFGFNLRVPVSAGILFVLAGTLEGLFNAGHPLPATGQARGRQAILALGALILVAATLMNSRVFAAEYALLRGMAAEQEAIRLFQDNHTADATAKVAEARAEFVRGEQLTPWNDAFAWSRGRLALARLDNDGAIEHFARALERNPYGIMTQLPMAQAKLQRAQRYLQEHRDDVDTAMTMLDDAASHARAVLAIAPGFARAEGVLGHIAAVSAIFLSAAKPEGNEARIEEYWASAEEHLEKALRHGVKGEGWLFRLLAKVRLARGKPLQAEAALVRAALADPADMETWPLFIDFANQNKRYDRIRNTLYAQIRALEEASPQNLDALATSELWLANVLENGYQDYDGVDAAYLKAVAYGPMRAEIWTNFARYAQAKGRVAALRQAIAQSSAQRQLAGEKPLPHVGALATVLQFGPRALDAASSVLLEQVRGHRNSGSMTATEAYGWAARMMMESLPATPGGPEMPCEAYMNLGIAYAGMQDPALAVRLFEAADTCLPPAQRAFLAVHWADQLVRQGDPLAALGRLEAGRGLDPENLDVRWAIARTLVKLDRKAEATAEYDALLATPGLDAKAKEVLQRERDGLQEAASTS
jgi:tetratricopeptide (TPR) repeat protein